MIIERIDHIVFTVADIEATVKFYTEVLNFELEIFNGNRKALKFGNQKINLHQKGKEFEPMALYPTCGAIDLCFITKLSISDIQNELSEKGIVIEEGIVERTGALGKINSIYLRDPDHNLIEISCYQ
ncbi:VOC family protein [Rhizosphaericola mali]|uniref:VOC family protein n=1 Tax=Rhizosphaericola mali TaxID=2545455 RepID=A0A5P2G4G6_9BACT|nr:VOC family protein [Rhizosphaericola mali]QES88712.1 VOC family protein [Rhizosphaericola mali]